MIIKNGLVIENNQLVKKDILVEDNKVKGIKLANTTEYLWDALILTTGTYLKSKILVGSTSKEEGPHGEESSKFLSTKLKFKIFWVNYF